MKLWVVYTDDYEGPYASKYYLDKELALCDYRERLQQGQNADWDEIETED